MRERGNVIIIGCTGCIGSHIEDALKEDYKIIHVSRSHMDFDLLDPVAIENSMNLVMQVLDRLEDSTIHGIIYACGVTIPNALDEMTLEQWQQTIDINLRGYWLCIKYLHEAIIRSPGCSIVQINSKTGKKGSYKNSAYAASMFGGIGLTQSLALEFAEYGVRVNAVCPGNVFESSMWKDNLFSEYSRTQNLTRDEVREKYTNLVPMKRCCTYDDIVGVVKFLLGPDSSYMTGQAINVTGGQQLN